MYDNNVFIGPPKLQPFQSVLLALNQLTRQEKKHLKLHLCIQIGLTLLDLIGVAIIGLLGSLAASGLLSQSQGKLTNGVLDFLHLENANYKNQVVVLGLISILILTLKSLLTMYFSKKNIKYLSRVAAQLSTKMFDKVVSSHYSYIRNKSIPDIIYQTTHGSINLVLGVISTSISLLVDFFLLMVLAILMFFIQPVVALVTVIFFSFVGILVHIFGSKNIRELGKSETEFNLLSIELLSGTLHGYRELRVRSAERSTIPEFSQMRSAMAVATAEVQFMPNIGKYILEAAIIVGAFLVACVQFLLGDFSQSIATLTIFFVSASRIAPAILRIQQGIASFSGSTGRSQSTLDFLKELEIQETIDYSIIKEFPDFKNAPSIEVRELQFKYNLEDKFQVGPMSFNVKAGSFIGIAGTSGSGKSTLIDLLLGLSKPTHGSIKLAGVEPRDLTSMDSNYIGFVPQEVFIANKSIAENLRLGVTGDFDIVKIENTLKSVGLFEFVEGLPNGIHTILGPGQITLSGGQKQRIGIARALLNRPKILILDESTSSLDAISEEVVTKAIDEMHGDTTIIVVAHRLATIKGADAILYLEDGKLKAEGSFSDLRTRVLDFDKQATLQGL